MLNQKEYKDMQTSEMLREIRLRAKREQKRKQIAASYEIISGVYKGFVIAVSIYTIIIGFCFLIYSIVQKIA